MTIRSEIESRLGAWANAQSPKLPVALENVSFTRPQAGNYVEIFLLQSVTTNREITATGQRIRGKFQINVYSKAGTGMGAVDAIVEQIIALYPVIPKTGTVSIESPLDASPAYVEDGFICVPITGAYRVEV